MMGERFGWSQKSDKKDEVLNSTYDYAIDNHPNMDWIEKYRYDSSVTQVGFNFDKKNERKAMEGQGLIVSALDL